MTERQRYTFDRGERPAPLPRRTFWQRFVDAASGEPILRGHRRPPPPKPKRDRSRYSERARTRDLRDARRRILRKEAERRVAATGRVLPECRPLFPLTIAERRVAADLALTRARRRIRTGTASTALPDGILPDAAHYRDRHNVPDPTPYPVAPAFTVDERKGDTVQRATLHSVGILPDAKLWPRPDAADLRRAYPRLFAAAPPQDAPTPADTAPSPNDAETPVQPATSDPGRVAGGQWRTDVPAPAPVPVAPTPADPLTARDVAAYMTAERARLARQWQFVTMDDIEYSNHQPARLGERYPTPEGWRYPTTVVRDDDADPTTVVFRDPTSGAEIARFINVGAAAPDPTRTIVDDTEHDEPVPAATRAVVTPRAEAGPPHTDPILLTVTSADDPTPERISWDVAHGPDDRAVGIVAECRALLRRTGYANWDTVALEWGDAMPAPDTAALDRYAAPTADADARTEAARWRIFDRSWGRNYVPQRTDDTPGCLMPGCEGIAAVAGICAPCWAALYGPIDAHAPDARGLIDNQLAARAALREHMVATCEGYTHRHADEYLAHLHAVAATLDDAPSDEYARMRLGFAEGRPAPLDPRDRAALAAREAERARWAVTEADLAQVRDAHTASPAYHRGGERVAHCTTCLAPWPCAPAKLCRAASEASA